MDNIQRGRDRAVWVTASPFLATQIKRDVKDVGLGRVAVYELSKFSPTHRLDLSGLGPGIMICTYRGLLSKFGRGEGDDEGGGGGGLEAAPKRVQQLVSWLGGWEWDGVLALDEAHKARARLNKEWA